MGAVLLVLMFAAGAAAGLAFGRTRPRAPAGGMPTGVPIATVDVQIRAGIPEELRRLDLTPEQSRRIEAVLAAGRRRSDSVMRELGPRLRMVFDSVDAAVRAELTPEQRARLAASRRGRPLRVIQESTVVNGKASGRTDTIRAP